MKRRLKEVTAVKRYAKRVAILEHQDKWGKDTKEVSRTVRDDRLEIRLRQVPKPPETGPRQSRLFTRYSVDAQRLNELLRS